MKLTEQRLQQLIRESIFKRIFGKKEKVVKTKEALPETIPPEIASDFGGGEIGDDFIIDDEKDDSSGISRRDFIKGAVGVAGGLALAGASGVLNNSSETGMSGVEQIIDQWFNDRFADGSFDVWYDHIGTFDFFEMWGDSPQVIIDYLLDFSPEEWNEPLVEHLESLGFGDPYSAPELFPKDYDYMSHVRSKLEEYYTDEKVDNLFYLKGRR